MGFYQFIKLFGCEWLKNLIQPQIACVFFGIMNCAALKQRKTVKCLSSFPQHKCYPAKADAASTRNKCTGIWGFELPDVGAEEEHFKVPSEMRTQEPITPCRVCSIPAPELCSSHPVNSQHPAEHAVFCWWCAQIHRCAGCMLSLWLSAVVITQKRGTGHVFFVFFMHGKIDTNYEMCTFLNHILILASFLI